MSGTYDPTDSHRLHLHGPTLGAGEPVAGATCPTCKQTGGMRVTAFIWQAARQLQWCCDTCRAMWVSPERRSGR